MICSKCKNEIENGLIYCPHCGESIQLVPNYDILEEELLTSIVEDKDKTVEFAEGVYANVEEQSLINSGDLQSLNNANTDGPEYSNRRFVVRVSIITGTLILFVLLIFVIINLYTNSYNYLYQHAVDAESIGKYTDATYYYREAALADDKSYDAVYNWGRMCFEIKDYNNCVEAMLAAHELDSTSTDIYIYLTKSYYALGETKKIYDLLGNTENQDVRELITSYIIFPPSFSIEEGEYNQDIELEIKSIDGYDIFYTLDGKDPTIQGFKFRHNVILTEGTTTINAVCCTEDGEYGEIVSKTYTISYDAPSMPIVTPSGGVFFEETLISIEVPEGASAYYTWDGSTPTEASTLYTGSFPVLPGGSVLSVIIIDKHGNVSEQYKSEFYLII